jgi:hypothetical protein
MNVSNHVRELVLARLREHDILVWYDPDRAFRGLFTLLADDRLVKVDASTSVLGARDAADTAWRQLFAVDSVEPARPRILVYVPEARHTDEDDRREDPFEPLALAGATFGATQAERLQSLARQALPGRAPEVDRLFAQGVPTLAELEALAGGTRYPFLQATLGTDVPARVATVLLCEPQRIGARVDDTTGLLPDLLRALSQGFGFPVDQPGGFDAIGPTFAHWLLFSEFVFDLPDAVPDSVVHVPRATATYQAPIYDLCHALRTSSEHGEHYRRIANEVEHRLGLSYLSRTARAFGDRDTFAFEDSAALQAMQELALAGDLAGARELVTKRHRSVWRAEAARDQLWRLAGRCLDLLEAGAAWETRKVSGGRPVGDHIRAYCAADDGLWRVDQSQRLTENDAAALVDRDALAPLLDHARRAYRKWLGDGQKAFLESVERHGWPPEGYPRHVQAWSRHGAGPAADGRKTAWFLVDALRYEMGRDLAERLHQEGAVTVEAACGVVPAATPFGMAALLPGAESGLTYEVRDEVLVPVMGGRPVLVPEDRRQVFRARYGDRFGSIWLDELLSTNTTQLREHIGNADVLAVFSTEIDNYGEHSSPRDARRYISGVVGDLLAAASRLVQLGFDRLVFVADHGFIQLPEVLAGDSCPEPGGRWVLKKRRALLGSLGTRSENVVALNAAAVGVLGPVEQVVVPRGVKVFRAGSPYFHEGVSLQECLVPFVVLDAAPRQRTTGGDAHVHITYRTDRFTSRIFSVRIAYSSLVRPALPVRVQAFLPGTMQVVGEAADCEARDPHTGLVTLSAAGQTQVPIAMNPDFEGDAVEIRVIDATVQGKVLASLRLNSALLD